ncbi:MAG TPA: hypothetical protein VHC97_20665 [Thermoanaerobaculia bacterium]|jgi:hypothetical protein|nr:hypothetical protein [Thermoanaerobaculia bacterium]
MKRYGSLFIIPLLGATLITGGCKGKPADDEASIKESLEEKGTIDVMDEISKAPEYKGPADGRLTDQQVKMYIEVRQREQKIREVALKELKAKGDKAKEEKREVGMFEAMKAIGDLADVATADLRAAHELGHNPNEYTWIKERVLEAQLAQTTQALNQQMVQGQQSMLKMLEEQKKLATDDTQRAELDKQIAEMKNSAAQAEANNTPGAEHNAQMIAKYKTEFDKLQAEDVRIAQQQNSSGQGGGQ